MHLQLEKFSPVGAVLTRLCFHYVDGLAYFGLLAAVAATIWRVFALRKWITCAPSPCKSATKAEPFHRADTGDAQLKFSNEAENDVPPADMGEIVEATASTASTLPECCRHRIGIAS